MIRLLNLHLLFWNALLATLLYLIDIRNWDVSKVRSTRLGQSSVAKSSKMFN